LCPEIKLKIMRRFIARNGGAATLTLLQVSTDTHFIRRVASPASASGASCSALVTLLIPLRSLL